MFKWFYDKTFAMKNGKMVIFEKKQPLYIEGLMGGKYLMFEPIVYTDWDDKQSKGVRITLGSSEIFTDIPVNIFAGFMYIINSIDMFTAAQNMINYIGHPDFGTNLFTFEKSEYVGKEEGSNIIKGRSIPVFREKQSRSVFDNLDSIGD